ncbi:MAG: site-specific DNA-methyltransferase [Gammaproteobacteria bacterium]
MDNPLNTRWARFGPYHATFPLEFASGVIKEHSRIADYVLDPFAGRGTSVYVASALGRNAVGIEIHPVGWIYGATKLRPAPMANVLHRLGEISNKACTYQRKTHDLPEFFKVCFCKKVLDFLFAAKELNWRKSHLDRTLMAFVLNDLHNNIGQGLSNQMKQTLSVSPEYALRWWRANGYSTPRNIDPQFILHKKIEWRYAKGSPKHHAHGKMFLGDSEKKLDEMKRRARPKQKFSLLLTSPPYWSVVNYHAAQWLRLWLLGGEPVPTYNTKKNRDRFQSKEKYQNLLLNVFSKCAMLMKPCGVIYVRTDAREFTFACTREALRKCFPNHEEELRESKPQKRQSELYKNAPHVGLGERDIILTRR